MKRYVMTVAVALAIGIGAPGQEAAAGTAAGAAARPIVDSTSAATEQIHYRGRYRYRSYGYRPGIYLYFGTPRYYRPYYYYSGPRYYYRYW